MKNTSLLNTQQELLYYVYRAFTSAPDAILAQRGWTRVHHRLLYFIARQPGITVSQLLEKLQVTKQAIHAPLKTLHKEGLLIYLTGETDRRVRHLSLSLAGEELERTLSSPQQALLSQAMAVCSEAEIAAWQKVMQAVLQVEKKSAE